MGERQLTPHLFLFPLHTVLLSHVPPLTTFYPSYVVFYTRFYSESFFFLVTHVFFSSAPRFCEAAPFRDPVHAAVETLPVAMAPDAGRRKHFLDRRLLPMGRIFEEEDDQEVPELLDGLEETRARVFHRAVVHEVQQPVAAVWLTEDHGEEEDDEDFGPQFHFAAPGGNGNPADLDWRVDPLQGAEVVYVEEDYPAWEGGFGFLDWTALAEASPGDTVPLRAGQGWLPFPPPEELLNGPAQEEGVSTVAPSLATAEASQGTAANPSFTDHDD